VGLVAVVPSVAADTEHEACFRGGWLLGLGRCCIALLGGQI
jgi:hypothetical protein